MKGVFITLEGIDGSGKSTLAQGLVHALAHLPVIGTRAPGGTDVGCKIRELILHGALHDIKSELFLFLADRSEHVASVIKPALEAGKVVICDRFNDSTIAYQTARGLDRTKLATFCDYATGGLKPDLTLFIDLDPQIAWDRVQKTRHKDRIENEGLYLLTQIDQVYKQLFFKNSQIVVLDGGLSKQELLQVALDSITQLINNRP